MIEHASKDCEHLCEFVEDCRIRARETPQNFALAHKCTEVVTPYAMNHHAAILRDRIRSKKTTSIEGRLKKRSVVEDGGEVS